MEDRRPLFKLLIGVKTARAAEKRTCRQWAPEAPNTTVINNWPEYLHCQPINNSYHFDFSSFLRSKSLMVSVPMRLNRQSPTWEVFYSCQIGWISEISTGMNQRSILKSSDRECFQTALVSKWLIGSSVKTGISHQHTYNIHLVAPGAQIGSFGWSFECFLPPGMNNGVVAVFMLFFFCFPNFPGSLWVFFSRFLFRGGRRLRPESPCNDFSNSFQVCAKAERINCTHHTPVLTRSFSGRARRKMEKQTEGKLWSRRSSGWLQPAV